jgi:hypothetical protein
MFVGHFAVAFAAKRGAPRIPLVALFVAVQWADILWPIFILLGIERSAIRPGITAVTPLDLQFIPYSHSLLLSLTWALLFALPAWRRRDGAAAVILGLAVFSHFVLDVLTHRPDMPISPFGETRIGLGLWESVPATLAVEGAMWFVGVWLYARSTRAISAMGRYGFWALVALLTITWLGAIFGPPPPGIIPAVTSMLVATALIIPWVRAIDRGRQSLVD